MQTKSASWRRRFGAASGMIASTGLLKAARAHQGDASRRGRRVSHGGLIQCILSLMGINRGTCLKSIKESLEIVPGANCLLTGDYLDFGGPSNLELHMQSDGNVCIYSSGNYVWCAHNKELPNGDYFLYVTEDGNLAAYSGTPDKIGDMVWSTGTGGSSLDYHYCLGLTAIVPLGGSVPVLYVALWSGDCSGPDAKDWLLGVPWKIVVGP